MLASIACYINHNRSIDRILFINVNVITGKLPCLYFWSTMYVFSLCFLLVVVIIVVVVLGFLTIKGPLTKRCLCAKCLYFAIWCLKINNLYLNNQVSLPSSFRLLLTKGGFLYHFISFTDPLRLSSSFHFSYWPI